jgi:hypothetical protein
MHICLKKTNPFTNSSPDPPLWELNAETLFSQKFPLTFAELRGSSLLRLKLGVWGWGNLRYKMLSDE